MTLAEMENLARQQLVAQRDSEAYQTLAAILKLDPSNANAYYLLSHIAHKFRNYAKEAEMLSEAIRLEPDNNRYKVYLARAKALYGDTDQAKAIIDQIALDELADIDLVDAVATTYNRLYLYREACQVYERLVSMERVGPSSWFNLGTCYKYTGDFSRSREAFQKAISLKPDYYKAQAALSSLGERGVKGDRAKELGDLLDLAPDTDSQLYVGHALAKEFERNGRYSESFDLLKRIKLRKKAEISYDFGTDQSIFSEIQKNLSSMESPANHKPDSVKDIFIVGMPRTGTTLLDRILSGLAGVCSGGELYNFNVALKKVRNLNGSQFIASSDIVGVDSEDLRKVGDIYQKATHYLRKKAVLTNKLPVNFLYTQQILESIPESIVICLDRNPMDAIVGNFRQLFSFDDGIYRYTLDLDDIARFYLCFRSLFGRLAEVYSNRFYVLNYEGMVSSPEGEIKKLLKFCNIPWDPNCLKIDENDQPVATASSVQVREKIHSRSIGQWERYRGHLSGVEEILRSGGISL